MTREEVYARISAERDRQDRKWGNQHHPPAWWLVILVEEVGEFAKAMFEGNPESLIEELTQVAAVAVVALEDLA